MRRLGEHLNLPQTSRANPVQWNSTHNKGELTAQHHLELTTQNHVYEVWGYTCVCLLLVSIGTSDVLTVNQSSANQPKLSAPVLQRSAEYVQ